MTGTDALLARFTKPGKEFGPLPLWWWSGAEVTRDRLRRQMEQLSAQGVHQAVVMCLAPTGPLYGSLADDPPFLSPQWVELLDGACADAEQLGFTLWMYDQIGFSGANFQGRLTAEHPEYAGLALFRDTDGVVRNRVSGFDYFGIDACAALLDQVHGELERQVGQRFGRAIGGFFQDELPAMPTWGYDFAETFADHYGYELEPRLESLFSGSGDDDVRVRRDYHEHRATLARRAFFDPLDAWFAKHEMICGFDQRSPAREGDPVGGVEIYGDYLATHKGFGAPGSDHWGDPKVHSSLAHAYGRPRTWIEAFHSSGWGGTLEETYDWLAPFLRRGATLYDPHAVYYSTAGGWWEWAPPSTCWRQPYWPSYHVFADAVARLCSVLTAGAHVCDTVLLSPTATAQAYTTLDGAQPEADRASRCYHRLNGVSAWYAERRGVLERAGVDHDVLDEATLADAVVEDGTLRVADETYRTVVVPDAHALHVSTAGLLARFVESGGRVVCVGDAPARFLGGDPSDAAAFSDAVARGDVVVVPTPDDVPDAVAHGPVRVTADAPFLLRRNGNAYVLMLTSHDDDTGTAAPIMDFGGDALDVEAFSWQDYWGQLHDTGYAFRPTGGRTAHVRVEGLPARAQRWAPGTGQRVDVQVSEAADGSLGFDVPFADGPITLVVLADDLPVTTAHALGEVVETVPVDGPWLGLASSTLDNGYGDLAAPDRDGVLPIEVWRFEHATGGDEWRPVTATYGPFAEVRDPDGTWRTAEWSLSRGIRNDPMHREALGPKGYVPEEFLDWRDVEAGGQVAVRCHLTLPSRDGLHVAVGADAGRRVLVDGVELPVEAAGYQSFSAIPRELTGRGVALDVELTAERDGPVRASFAVVTDPTSYRRPEWLTSGTTGHEGREVDFTRTFPLTEVPDDAAVQVASDGACRILVNGVEVGRQGDFSPYPGHREVRVHPYQVAEHLRVGDNEIVLRAVDAGAQPTAVALDSPGLGLCTDASWNASGGNASGTPTLRRQHARDPRFVCARPRPHPLPGAGWLEPDRPTDGVVGVVPDVAPGGERTERLRFPAPLGTVALHVPTSLDAAVLVDGREHAPDGGRVTFAEPLPAATPVTLRFRAVGGRRGGALLDGPVEVEVAETGTRLASWEELGLRALGGELRYRATVDVRPPDGTRTVLDLGDVRGTADVVVNGALVGRLVWSPWCAEVTDALRPGENEIEVVVRGTLAGYLDDASPTAAVAKGQVRTGLFGAVRLVHHRK
ncbi:MAG: hypothetical protein J2P24_07005 [Streptosporangiales bacterium]|nr:hypothetical protein [Streptosporangiales bacterium]MBO0889281.1 hypothetical protein [Acidothermales bacterium]